MKDWKPGSSWFLIKMNSILNPDKGQCRRQDFFLGGGRGGKYLESEKDIWGLLSSRIISWLFYKKILQVKKVRFP